MQITRLKSTWFSRKVQAPLRIANHLQDTRSFVACMPLVVLFKAFFLLQLIIELLDSLGRVPLSKGNKQTLWRRKTSTLLLNRVKGRFWTGFATNFNLSKSVHDFIFRPWGKPQTCTNSANKEIKVKPCLSRLTLLKHFIVQFWTKTGSFGPKLAGLTK